jgi:hypothetical protein
MTMNEINNGAIAFQREETGGYVTGIVPLKFLKYAGYSDDGWSSLSREEIASILGNAARLGGEKGRCAYFVAVPTPEEAAQLEEFELKKAAAVVFRNGECGGKCGCDRLMQEEIMRLVPKRVDCYFIRDIGECGLGDKVPASMLVLSLGRVVGAEKSTRVRG